jgi:hypothetical protein
MPSFYVISNNNNDKFVLERKMNAKRFANPVYDWIDDTTPINDLKYILKVLNISDLDQLYPNLNIDNDDERYFIIVDTLDNIKGVSSSFDVFDYNDIMNAQTTISGNLMRNVPIYGTSELVNITKDAYEMIEKARTTFKNFSQVKLNELLQRKNQQNTFMSVHEFLQQTGNTGNHPYADAISSLYEMPKIGKKLLREWNAKLNHGNTQ